MRTVLLAVGDGSGDAIAAELVTALREIRPDTRFLGLAGVAMEKCGVRAVADQRELAVGGIVELVPSLPRIVRVWRRMVVALRESRPDLVVLVDSSGFNLALARRARHLGVPVLYYVSPQVWAWRPGRVTKLARRVDRLAAIFPFEPRCYEGAGLPVDYVGHPLLDRLGDVAAAGDRASARRRLGLPTDAPVVALMPGSRRNELRHGLAVFVKTAQVVHAREPRSVFVLPVAPSLDALQVESAVRRLPGAANLPLRFVVGEAITALAACDVALQKPGTATLEAAILGRPLVVAARIHPVTAAIVRRAAAVDCTAMPNLIAGRRIVPEFLQAEAEPTAIAAALLRLLAGPERERQLAGLREVRRLLGPCGAARRTAAIAAEMLGAGRRS